MPILPVKFPIDFEEKVKAPPAPGGGGYPYQISAKDLMEDFHTAALQVDDTPVGGLQLTETRAKGRRTVALTGAVGGYAVGSGALIFQDCAGAEVARIEWVNGIIITTGEQTVETGCDGAGTIS